MRQFFYQLCYIRYQGSFYLWRIGAVLKQNIFTKIVDWFVKVIKSLIFIDSNFAWKSFFCWKGLHFVKSSILFQFNWICFSNKVVKNPKAIILFFSLSPNWGRSSSKCLSLKTWISVNKIWSSCFFWITLDYLLWSLDYFVRARSTKSKRVFDVFKIISLIFCRTFFFPETVGNSCLI